MTSGPGASSDITARAARVRTATPTVPSSHLRRLDIAGVPVGGGGVVAAASWRATPVGVTRASRVSGGGISVAPSGTGGRGVAASWSSSQRIVGVVGRPSGSAEQARSSTVRSVSSTPSKIISWNASEWAFIGQRAVSSRSIVVAAA